MGFVKDFSGEMVGFSCRKYARLIKRMGRIVFFVLIDSKKQDDITLFSDLFMLFSASGHTSPFTPCGVFSSN